MSTNFGYITPSGTFVTVGTERGAKIAATRAGYTAIGYLSKHSNIFIMTERKHRGYWIPDVCERYIPTKSTFERSQRTLGMTFSG